MADRYLVVFDCVTFLQSLISEAGPAVRCLELFQEGKFSLAISGETLSEIKEVLSRSTLRDRYPLLTEESVERLLALLRYKGNFFRKPKRHYKYLRDRGDEPYLNLCIEAQADFLVTRDKDLLDLMRWEDQQGREFQKQFPQLRILDPAMFLGEIEKTRSKPIVYDT